MYRPSYRDESSFWEAIRNEKMAKKDYDFSGYIFPDFQFTSLNNLFWKFEREGERNNKAFPGNVSFCGAKFLGEAKFDLVSFSGKADFSEAIFSKEAHFRRATFSGQANFTNATFSGNANFGGVEFLEEVHFSRSIFSGWADFMGAAFTYADFGYVTFSGMTSFQGASCTAGAALIGARGNIEGLDNGRIMIRRK